MNRVLTLYSSLLLALSLNSCSTNCGTDPQPCQPQPLPISSLATEYGCTAEPQLRQKPAEAYSVFIRTQAEFDQLVGGECHPAVDFKLFDLVIGRNGGSSGERYRYDYRQECPSGQRVLRVLVQPGITNDFVFQSYHVLVPKLLATETGEVRVEVVK